MLILKRKKTTLICGDWFCYIWWNRNGKIILAQMNVNIKKGILSEYNATYSDSSDTYFGKAFIECNNLCINMSLKNNTVYEGTTFHRYDLSTTTNRNQLYGFWLSRNADKKVSCGGTILSRKKINKNQCSEIIKQKYCINTEIPVLSLVF